MASLTPLSKGLIGLAVLGGMASAVWHLALKERWAEHAATSQSSVPVSAPNTVVTPAQLPPANATPASPTTLPAPGKANAAESAELGRKLLDKGDYAQARGHLETAVQAGDAGAACHLGDMTLKGQGGISANQEKAAALFQLAQSRGAICFASGK